MRNVEQVAECKDEQIVVSVIMPVFNSEEYVAQSVNSILAQDYDSFELIAIDDGSTDNSGNILDAIAEKDSRLRVVHRENGGMCSARNLGIEIAKGDYVMFADNDDECLPGFIGENVSLAISSGADCVRFGRMLQRIDSSGKVVREVVGTPPARRICAPEEMGDKPEQFYYDGSGGVWTGVYKREFLLNENLRFDERLRHGYEDTLFNDQVYGKARTIAFNDKHLYVWKRRETHSSSMIASDDKLLGIALVLALEDSLFIRYNMHEKQERFCANRITLCVKDLLTASNYRTTRRYCEERVLYEQARRLIAPYAVHIRGKRFDPTLYAISNSLLNQRYTFLYTYLGIGSSLKKLLIAL